MTIRPTRTAASCEKRRKASRRSAVAVGQTTKASCASPPTQRQAAERCTQSASSERHEEPVSTAECPESERPEQSTSPSTRAGQSSTGRSVSQARKRIAPSSAKPSVITMKAVPKRVPWARSEEHTSELQSRENLVCRLLLEKKKKKT